MKQDPLDDRIALLEKPPPIVASHEGIPLVLQALREKLIQAEAEVRKLALIYHADYTKGVRAGLAVALFLLYHPEFTWYHPETFWQQVRAESREFEAEAQKERVGRHKG